jgi:hypothetical protein
MKPQWYIPEPHHDSDNARRLISILQEMDIDVFSNKYVPFGKMDYSFLDPNRPVILYGYLGIVKDVFRRHIYLSPFAWCNFNELKCSNYYTFWGNYIVQQLYAFYPLDEIARNRDFIFKTYGSSDCVFIRPDDNMKTFIGEVVEKEKFEYWWRHCRDQSNPNCLCVVSRPEPIQKEWRFVIKEGKVITGSQYLPEVKSNFPDAAASKAEEIARTPWQPHPIYIMDIALTNGEYRLMECGSINVAGLYSCDLKAFIRAINDLLPEEFVPPVLNEHILS